MSSIYVNGTKILMPADIDGGGINLLEGTMDVSSFRVSTSLATSGNSTDPVQGVAHTKTFHVWGAKLMDAGLRYDKDIYLPAGTYTLSFFARANGKANGNKPSDATRTVNLNLFSSYTDTHGGDGLASVIINNDWNKYSMTFTLAEAVTHSGLRLVEWSSNTIPGGSLYFADVKLEKGSVATPYSPSPLDLWNDIQDLKSQNGGVARHTNPLISMVLLPSEMEVA